MTFVPSECPTTSTWDLPAALLERGDRFFDLFFDFAVVVLGRGRRASCSRSLRPSRAGSRCFRSASPARRSSSRRSRRRARTAPAGVHRWRRTPPGQPSSSGRPRPPRQSAAPNRACDSRNAAFVRYSQISSRFRLASSSRAPPGGSRHTGDRADRVPALCSPQPRLSSLSPAPAGPLPAGPLHGPTQ